MKAEDFQEANRMPKSHTADFKANMMRFAM